MLYTLVVTGLGAAQDQVGLSEWGITSVGFTVWGITADWSIWALDSRVLSGH